MFIAAWLPFTGWVKTFEVATIAFLIFAGLVAGSPSMKTYTGITLVKFTLLFD